MDELLTTRQAATELRVSESSVKRWCNLGFITTQRTAGGHRRIGRSALKQFADSHLASLSIANNLSVGNNNLPVTVKEPIDVYQPLTREDLVRRFQQALVSGNESACKDIIEIWCNQYLGMAMLGDLLIAGAMDTIGRLWECGRAEIYEERRSCEICFQLLSELRLRVPELPASAPKAIGGTISGDHYTLANSLVELVLRDAGWNATNLGGDLPLETFLVAVQREKPKLLWLSISHVEDSEVFVAAYNKFYSQLPPSVAVVVGGKALTDDLRPRMGFLAHCDNLEQLAALAKVIGGAS